MGKDRIAFSAATYYRDIFVILDLRSGCYLGGGGQPSCQTDPSSDTFSYLDCTLSESLQVQLEFY